MAIIDFHNHFYPPEYLEALRAGPSNIQVTFDRGGNPLLHYPGDYNIVVPGHRDIDFRAKVLEGVGIDMQILTLTTPGTHVESPQRAIELAQIVNNGLAKIIHERSEKFSALATLPLNVPQASEVELDRAFSELGFKGVMVFSNVNGVSLSDKRFWPLYEKADRWKAVFYIHPTFPAGVEVMTDYWLMPLIGFPCDRHWLQPSWFSAEWSRNFQGLNGFLGILAEQFLILPRDLIEDFSPFENAERTSAERRVNT